MCEKLHLSLLHTRFSLVRYILQTKQIVSFYQPFILCFYGILYTYPCCKCHNIKHWTSTESCFNSRNYLLRPMNNVPSTFIILPLQGSSVYHTIQLDLPAYFSCFFSFMSYIMYAASQPSRSIGMVIYKKSTNPVYV